jgi:hypothetical protein
VPSVGFGLDWHFQTGDAILASLTSLLDPLVKDQRAEFNVARPEQFSVTINRNDGYIFGVEPAKAFVSFQHLMRPKAVSGGLPVMEMASRQMPYSDLLSHVWRLLIDLTLTIPSGPRRSVTRVGVVTSTVVADNDAPPGIRRFVESIGRPWEHGTESFSVQITSILDKTPKWVDKCIHSVTRPEQPDQMLRLSFDWHRTFESGRRLRRDILESISREAQVNALAYFEDLAEGSRFNELVDGATAD